MPVEIVIDSDTFNEIDDQFAIAYALCRPERLTVLALLAAPFQNEKAETPADGMRKSLWEMYRIRALCHSNAPIFAGSETYLPRSGQPVESPACDALIRLARSMPAGQRLRVVAIAALTNVASALLKAPDIKDSIVIEWLGANAANFATQDEFNLRQDRAAAQVVLNSGAPVVWYPCRGVCSHLTLTLWEAEHWLKGRNELADALCALLRQSGATGMGQSRVVWDIAPIAALCDPGCVQLAETPSPIVTEGALQFPPDRQPILVVQMIARDRVFADFFSAVCAFTPDGKGRNVPKAAEEAPVRNDNAN